MKRPTSKPTAPTDLLSEIDRVRSAIQATRHELADLADAPLPASEAKQHATAAIAHMAQSFNLPALARAFTSPDRGTHAPDTVFRHANVLDIRNEHAGLALLAVALPDALEKALHRSIDEQIGDAGVSATERAQRVEVLEQRLFELGCEEERLVCQAEDNGLTVYRRADADPACVLGFFTDDEAA